MTAVIYARYSSDSQREASIEGQLRDCKAYAEKNGITVVGTYIDRAYSAKTDDRPDFQRMIKDLSLIHIYYWPNCRHHRQVHARVNLFHN